MFQGQCGCAVIGGKCNCPVVAAKVPKLFLDKLKRTERREKRWVLKCGGVRCCTVGDILLMQCPLRGRCVGRNVDGMPVRAASVSVCKSLPLPFTALELFQESSQHQTTRSNQSQDAPGPDCAQGCTSLLAIMASFWDDPRPTVTVFLTPPFRPKSRG